MIAFLGVWHEQDLLARIEPLSILQYLSKLGSVDGVTRINQLTEDGLPASEGQVLIQKLRNITSFCE
jgi:hypothetical protein